MCQFVVNTIFSVWPVSALHHFVLSPVLASAQRPEDVIQRYMEVVAGVQDEVSWFVFPSQMKEKKVYSQSFLQANVQQKES